MKNENRCCFAPLLAIVVGMLCSPLSAAQDVIQVRRMTMELARDIAQGAVLACREQGYQVAAVVVGREGNDQIVMRDTLASHFTVDIARSKANAVILSGIASGDLRRNRGDIRPELNHLKDLLIMEGGLPVSAAGAVLGAVGVSGAPGGDLDAACATAGLEAVQDRLDFAD